MIKDISEISQLDADLLDTDDNAEDFYEIVEFVRIGVLIYSRNASALQTGLY